MADQTFQKFTPEQAQEYLKNRNSPFPDELFETIIAYHKSNPDPPEAGQQTDHVVDFGCGPGIGTRDLLRFWNRVTGVDPGESMIEVATKAMQVAEYDQVRSRIQFVLSPAEQVEKNGTLPKSSVDVVCSAQACHWFDLPAFYAEIEKILKPGGTVALWTRASLYCHPETPNATQVQDVLNRIEHEILKPYWEPGNAMSRSLYQTLPLPWTCDPQATGFDESSFVRHEWDTKGILTAGPKGEFFLPTRAATLEQLKAALQSSGPHIRWRKAHPDEKDCLDEPLDEIRRLVAPVEKLKGSPSVALLMFRKKSNV